MCLFAQQLSLMRIRTRLPQAEALDALESAVASLCECEQYLELAQCLNDISDTDPNPFSPQPVAGAPSGCLLPTLFVRDILPARRQLAATKSAKKSYKSAIASWRRAQHHLPLLPTWPTEDPHGTIHNVSAVRLLLRGRAASTIAKQRRCLDGSYENIVRLRDATTAAMMLLRRSQRLGWWVQSAKVSPTSTSAAERAFWVETAAV